ncbi:MAG TPA: glutathione S-transferase N-terminal domain-containing protein, partial [Polyangia bacterium]
MSTPQLVLCELADTGLPGFESFSPFCLKTHRALAIARLPYTRRHGARPDPFRRYNPARQVPVLLVDGEPVADSTEILRRIVALRPGALAADPEAWLWEELADTALYGFVVASRWADDRNWPLTRAAYFAGMPAL